VRLHCESQRETTFCCARSFCLETDESASF